MASTPESDVAAAGWEPDLDEATVDEYPLDLGSDDRLYIRMVEHHYEGLIDFSIVQQTRGVTGQWHDVVRADCCHGKVHLHRFDRHGNKSIEDLVPIERQADVAAGYDMVNDAIVVNWEENLRRWKS